MSANALLYPALVQVAMTFGLLHWMGIARVRSVRLGETKIKDIALGQSAWPARITQIGNSFQSQLELPVLFYVLVVFCLITSINDRVLLTLAWCFVALRMVHIWIHTGSNRVTARFRAYWAGLSVLVAMWFYFAAHLLLKSM